MKLSALFLTAMAAGADAKGVRGKRKLQLQLVGYGGEPNPSRFPLNLCEGDCDNDAQCAEGLVCFQRQVPPPGGEWQEVPGCIGGREWTSKTDFCIVAPEAPNMTQPTWPPTWPPTNSPTVTTTMSGTTGPTEMATDPSYWLLPELEFVGDNAALLGSPLGLCQGDCDNDDDCIDELICFQRDYEEDVPGCRPGQDFASVDYCVMPPPPDVTEAVTMSPTTGATMAQTEFAVALQAVGDNVGFPLGLCQGDCDTNDDCLDDLICFQRDMFEPIPGCIGQGLASYDYCIIDPNATPSPTTSMNFTTAPGIMMNATSAPGMMETSPPVSAPTALPMFNTSVVVQAQEAPTEAPTIRLPLLATVSKDTEGPLGLCQGDCETNEDCAPGLICLNREKDDVVPGCAGVPNKGDDYCVYPF